MSYWITVVLAWAAGIELVCIVFLLAMLRIMAREVNEGRQIYPVEIEPKDEINVADIRREEPYWIGPDDPDEDDGR